MRAATLSDYNAVVAIDRDVYSGLDYLPATYPTLLQKPGSSAYVYEKGERVVGFVIADLVDGGQTLVTSAARIAADCRKGGMYSRFIRQVFQQFRGSRHPDYVAFSTNNFNMAANGHKLLKTYRIVEERVITTVLVDLTQAKQKVLREDSDVPALKQQSREDIEDMMSLSQSYLKLLFPNGRVTVEWKPIAVPTSGLQNWPVIEAN
nr:hypothetical protein BaRGS_002478 [Batillaria attramentaria]